MEQYNVITHLAIKLKWYLKLPNSLLICGKSVSVLCEFVLTRTGRKEGRKEMFYLTPGQIYFTLQMLHVCQVHIFSFM